VVLVRGGEGHEGRRGHEERDEPHRGGRENADRAARTSMLVCSCWPTRRRGGEGVSPARLGSVEFFGRP
jgi:hypothetical protein